MIIDVNVDAVIQTNIVLGMPTSETGICLNCRKSGWRSYELDQSMGI